MTRSPLERQHLMQANLRVVEAEKRIAAQRALIARLENEGRDSEGSRKLLASMLDGLESMKAHRRQILEQLANGAP
ncbi:hypothetical protein [Noviherbaspirillum malthae]|uniref:hypothetical protein n=1 Tax=Noviherbaspirillum malthae TaxID=1260987 RepID=UPI0018904480|nr:hypothetical protein [Noviherbaspirillum malthae]